MFVFCNTEKMTSDLKVRLKKEIEICLLKNPNATGREVLSFLRTGRTQDGFHNLKPI